MTQTSLLTSETDKSLEIWEIENKGIKGIKATNNLILVRCAGSQDPYLEILLEVNLNFQVRLTIILANGIFSR